MSASKPVDPLPIHIVLVHPEIPNNTGNIGRSCVSMGMALHLIHPISFDLSEKACRRAGLDYWPRLDLHEHASWDAYTQHHPHARRWFFTTKATRPLFDAHFAPGDHLVFGSETAGFPPALNKHITNTQSLALPMRPGERSLNLATAVCAAGYEAIRQLLAHDQLRLDANGRLVMPC